MSSALDKLKKFTRDKWRVSLVQFIKFGIIGVGNTLLSTGIYYIFIAIDPSLYMLGNVVGWIISVFNSFYWNNRFVFKNSWFPWAKRLLRTYVAYGGSFLLGSATLFIMVDLLHVSQWLAPWVNLVLTIPLNFILNKFWAFKA